MKYSKTTNLIRCLLLAALAIGAFLPTGAFADGNTGGNTSSNLGTPGNCSTSGTSAAACQFEVTSVSQAPAPSVSEGIRLDPGVYAVLFANYNYPANSPIFIANSGTSPYFVPQNTLGEYTDFINYLPSGVSYIPAIPPGTPLTNPYYSSICPFVNPSPNPASIAISVPVNNYSGVQPYIVNYYTLPLSPATSTTTYATQTTPTRTTPASPIEFIYQTAQSLCTTDFEGTKSCDPPQPTYYKEDQNLVSFTEKNAAPPYVWGNGVVQQAQLYSSLSVSGPWATASCPAYPTIAGVCNLATSGHVVAPTPTGASLCSSGNLPAGGSNPTPTPAVVTDASGNNIGWSWTCQSVQNGAVVAGGETCSAAASGTCGSANGGTFATSPPTNQLCSFGVPTVPQDNLTATTDTWTWSCQTVQNGSVVGSASCSATNSTTITGQCNAATEAGTYITAPSSDLCTAGLPTAVTSNTTAGQWQWTCNNEQYDTAVPGTGQTCAATLELQCAATTKQIVASCSYSGGTSVGGESTETETCSTENWNLPTSTPGTLEIWGGNACACSSTGSWQCSYSATPPGSSSQVTSTFQPGIGGNSTADSADGAAATAAAAAATAGGGTNGTGDSNSSSSNGVDGNGVGAGP